MSTIGVCFGGPSPEHDVSVLTGLQAAQELARSQRTVTCLYWSKTGEWFEVGADLEAEAFLDGVPRGAQPLQLVTSAAGGFLPAKGARGLLGSSKARALELDAVVNCCHGGPGEDGTLQGALDLAGIRYTGPGVAASALGMDKLAFAAAAHSAGLTVLPRILLDDSEGSQKPDFDGPYICKPRFGGSSIGVEVVADLDTARARLRANVHLHRGAVIEPFRADLFDLNVAIRTWPTVETSSVEKPERTTAGAEILGYNDKYVGGEGMVSAPRELPAAIPPELTERVTETALQTANLIGARGVHRVDFLSDGVDELYLNEVNTIPGSLARYLWVDPPVAFSGLLDAMIDEATSVASYRPSAAGADGTVLRYAGSIAGKLG